MSIESDEPDELTPLQHKAIGALLSEKTIVAAAAQIDVNESTIRRWLGVPKFKAAYNAALNTVCAAGLDQAKKHTSAAVDALVKNLDCKNRTVANTAAKTLIETRGLERSELHDRLEKVEQRQAEQADATAKHEPAGAEVSDTPPAAFAPKVPDAETEAEE